MCLNYGSEQPLVFLLELLYLSGYITEGKLYIELSKQADAFVLVHEVPEAPSPQCFRDFRDHLSDMPYDILKNTE